MNENICKKSLLSDKEISAVMKGKEEKDENEPEN